MKKNATEVWTVAFKSLLVHVLSSGYNVPGFWLCKTGKAAQQKSFCITNNNCVLNQIYVCHERVCAEKVARKNWLIRSFSTKDYTKFIANIVSKNVSQVPTEKLQNQIFQLQGKI